MVAGNPAKLIRVMDKQDPSLAMKYGEFVDSCILLVASFVFLKWIM